MVVVGAFGLILGVVLSQYFKVLVLIPSSLCATTIVFFLTLYRAYHLIDTLIICAEVVFALNIGYLIGLSSRLLFIKEQKAARSGKAWLS